MDMLKNNNNNRLILKTPASWQGNLWREALPAGNGTIGAMVYGGVCNEVVLLNHSDLWYGLKRDEMPDISGSLQTVRDLMDEKKYHEADQYTCQLLKDAGYAPQIAEPFPLADLKITMPVNKGFKGYERSLDMETGEIKVGWQDADVFYERVLFVSRTEHAVIYEIRASKEGRINGSFSLGLHDEADSRYPLADQRLENSCCVKTEGAYAYYGVTNSDGLDFGAVMHIVTQDGEVSAKNDLLKVTQATKVFICIQLFVKGNRETEWANLKQHIRKNPHRLSAVVEQSYSAT
jgi:alpha-L-fucosidase 2